MFAAAALVGLTLGVAATPNPPGAEAPQKPAESSVDACAASGCYLDIHGATRDAAADYRALIRRQRKARDWWLTTGESVAMLGAGAFWYFVLDLELNQEDWDFPSLSDRFDGDAVRYDNNDYAINWLWHPLSGIAYYTLPRHNGFRMWGSLGWATATSLMWEYGIEFNEKVSINDIPTTPLAGLALGEFIYKFQRYMNSAAHPSRRQRAFGWMFGFVEALHAKSHHFAHPEAAPDRYGLNSLYWHRFEARAGVGPRIADRSERGTASRLSFAGEIVTIPGYRRPGRFVRGFWDGDFARFDLDLDIGPKGGASILYGETAMAGVVLQDTDRRGRGVAAVFDLNVAMTYRKDATVGGLDRFAAMHFPGPEARFVAQGSGVALDVRVAGHLDLVGLDALGHREWQAANPGVVGKTVVRKQGYYYAWGPSIRIETRVDLDGVAFGARGFLGAYDSHEGFDRSQEKVEVDQPIEGRWREAEGWLRVGLGRTAVFVEARAGLRRYDESFAGARHKRSRLWSMGSVGLQF